MSVVCGHWGRCPTGAKSPSSSRLIDAPAEFRRSQLGQRPLRRNNRSKQSRPRALTTIRLPNPTPLFANHIGRFEAALNVVRQGLEIIPIAAQVRLRDVYDAGINES